MYYRQDAPTELNAAIEKDVLKVRQPYIIKPFDKSR
jgi:hypothetical protein